MTDSLLSKVSGLADQALCRFAPSQANVAYMGWNLLKLPTAHCHGIAAEAIRHALRNAIRHTEQHGRMTMYTGPG
ncbi:hypothetical protein GCM10010471_28950 [Leucobacter komagatae]